MTKYNNEDFVGVGIFAGAGGLDTGMINSGINFQLAIDFDKSACKTYQVNHPETTVWHRDVSTISGQEIRNVVGNKQIILAGGPPCQSWSGFQEEIEGSNKGLEDIRGQMIYQYLRIAKELQPVAVVFENVPYMVNNPAHLVEFNKFKIKLQECTGLKLEYQVLNALDYGVAQLRERVIMIGTKEGIPNPFQFLRKKDGPKTLREAIENCPPSEFFHFKKTDRDIMKYIKEGQCWKNLSPEVAYEHMKKEYRGICLDCKNNFQGSIQCPKCNSRRIKNGYGITSYLRRLSWDKPSPTICAVPTNKTHGLLAHPSQERCLSISESSTLQGFPTDYQFEGTIFEKQRQIGNAVPVKMGEAIGEAIIEAINQSTLNTSNEVSDTTNDVQLLKDIVLNPNRFILSELEKDLVRLAFKLHQQKKPFPPRYHIYLKEISAKLVGHSRNIAI